MTRYHPDMTKPKPYTATLAGRCLRWIFGIAVILVIIALSLAPVAIEFLRTRLRRA
jgi:hypothetical protein